MDIEKVFTKSFPGFLSIRNSEHKIVYLNDNFREWIGKYTSVDPIGKTNDELSSLVEENVANVFRCCHDASLDFIQHNTSNNSLKRIIPFDNDDNTTEYFEVVKYAQKIEGENHILTVCFDITGLYLENKKNLSASLRDSLTGLYNRAFLNTVDNEYFKGKVFACIDLDNFKEVNDTHGHHVGDQVLITFSKLLKKSAKQNDVIRLGGDEFLLILDYKSTEMCYGLFFDLQSEFNKAFLDFPNLSFSFGLCRYYQNLEKSIRKADSIMYTSKFTKNK